MKFKIFFFCSICLFSSLLFSATWHIKLDGTGDFTSIQEGINVSVNADTVLVYPGTYYENINFSGKNLTIASLELITGDDQYITHTIIDGQQLDSVVRLHSNEDNCVLRGFTISNGKGHFSLPNLGGGIAIFGDSNDLIELNIVNCIIENNFGSNSGGIQCVEANLFLSGTIIRNNYAIAVGGGINIVGYSTVTFDPVNRCSIYDNIACTGADIYIADSCVPNIDVYLDTFTVSEPSRYFAGSYFEEIQMSFSIQNHTLELVDQDLYVSPYGDDNNSGLTPDDPMKTILLAVRKMRSDQFNPKVVHLAPGIYSQSLNNQLYPIGSKSFVSIDGAGKNETILDGDDQFCKFMFLGCHISDFDISNMTFQNANHDTGVVSFTKIFNVNFRNIGFRNNYIYDVGTMVDSGQSHNIQYINVSFENNVSDKFNAGLYVAGSENIKISNCSFTNNEIVSSMVNSSALNLSFYGYAIIENSFFQGNYSENISPNQSGARTVSVYRHNTWDGDIYITNSLFCDNFASGNTADQVLVTRSEVGSSTLISNCIFTNNQNSSIGNSATFVPMGNISISNSIFNNSSTNEIILGDRTQWGYIDTLSIQYCNIDGGQNAIVNQNNANIVNWLEGNIDEYPQFLLSGNDPYQLSEFSPCIDAGTPDTTGLFLPPFDLLHHERIWDGDNNGEAIIDMGCYEFGADSVGVTNNQLPMTSSQMTNYPNPFNPTTTIYFETTNLHELPRIEIYNLKGQKVKTLPVILSDSKNRIEGSGTIMSYSVVWNGTDQNNKPVSSGIYFALLKAGNVEASTKMLLLK
ncbi:MAG: hypothetical protein K9N09_11310 [Candidatus Cloacimonetes bacterium]|nr:hypothetical protein [Candidatus Cloacimonadota bacterium]MCF7815026.1 hypothetical protein [Candidatus Cloacimonadota bacterium]MCF7869272.1 hypothetical protein [Candidatus Cloacimonadota bacterium]MCF7884702.1 hypothetical protein [Candidatus Cloacimonadota bacterium]